MNSFPVSPEFLFIIGFILIIELLSKKFDRLKIGRMGVLGIFIALLHLDCINIAVRCQVFINSIFCQVM